MSNNKHTRAIHFARQTKRNLKQTLFPFEGYKFDYDKSVASKDKTLKNLNQVAVEMSKSAGRVPYKSYIPKKDNSTIDSFDPQRAFFAKRDYANGGKRQVTYSKMSNSQARDEMMYDTTDFRFNVNMDNTKMERQAELDKKNELRMMRMRMHTQQSLKRQGWKNTNKLNSTMNSFNVLQVEKKF